MEEQFRSKSNLSAFDRLFTEATLNYDPGKQEWLKPLELSFTARHLTVNDNVGNKQGLEYFFRYQTDVRYKFNIDRFSISYRFRYQNRNQLGTTKSEGDTPVEDVRHKITFDYNIKSWKLDPTLEFELFNRKNDEAVYDFDRYRIRLETKYKINKKQDFTFFIMREREIINIAPKTTYILGLKYTFMAKRKKSKKE